MLESRGGESQQKQAGRHRLRNETSDFASREGARMNVQVGSSGHKAIDKRCLGIRQPALRGNESISTMSRSRVTSSHSQINSLPGRGLTARRDDSCSRKRAPTS